MKPTQALILLLAQVFPIYPQFLFHQDIFYGGVSAGGFSTGWAYGGSGVVKLHIESGSTIRKAYLFAYRLGYSFPITITVNGTNFTIDTNKLIMNVRHHYSLVNPVSLYYLDITSSLNALGGDTFYVTIPQNGTGPPTDWGWRGIYFYIEYENPYLSKISASLWINDKNLMGYEAYNVKGMNIVDNTKPVGLSCMLDGIGIACSAERIVAINGTEIGTLYKEDSVNWVYPCSGGKGHFYHQNDSIYGLDDDTPDSIMSGSDALANISKYLPNGTTEYSLLLKDGDYPNVLPGNPSAILFVVNTYSTPCDTFSTYISTNTIEICKGDTVHLSANGGTIYHWYPQKWISNPNVPDPLVFPDSSIVYVVRIEKTPGCSRTESVVIKVHQPPQIQNIKITPSACGDSTGEVEIVAVGNSPLIYYLNNQASYTGRFSFLPSDTYIIRIIDGHGCETDTLIVVPAINDVSASFTPRPAEGQNPLTVKFENNSVNATNFMWFINDSLFSTDYSPSYTFSEAGVYEIKLIASNDFSWCSDTFSKNVIVDESVMITIPDIITPNRDGENDYFYIKASGIKNINAFIFDITGKVVTTYYGSVEESGEQEIMVWDSKGAAGMYFYIIEAVDKKENKHTYKGKVEVVK